MGTDVDEYVATFETLVRKAGYDLRDDMVVDVFTNGLPAALYSLIYNIDNPHTYDQWREVVLIRQEKYLHLKARKEALERNFGSTKKPNTPQSKPRDPNAMDTTLGRTRARGANDEEEHQPPPYPPRAGPGTRARDMSKVKCYNCNQYGHIGHQCQKPRKPREENARVTQEDTNPQQMPKDR